MGIQFDFTVNIGTLFTLVAFIFGGGAFVALVNYRMKVVEDKLDNMKDVMMELARQEERQNSLERRIDDLQHGRGFILDDHILLRGRQNV